MWIDVLTIAFPSLVALVPSWLLYRQNQKSGEREAAERASERAYQFEMRKLDLGNARDEEARKAKEAEYVQTRERFVRFLALSQEVVGHYRGQDMMGHLAPVPPSLQEGLATAYEYALLEATGNQFLQQQLKIVYDIMSSYAVDETHDYERFTNRLSFLRPAIDNLLAERRGDAPEMGTIDPVG